MINLTVDGITVWYDTRLDCRKPDFIIKASDPIEFSKLNDPAKWHDDEQCAICGDSDCIGGLPCETGDGV